MVEPTRREVELALRVAELQIAARDALAKVDRATEHLLDAEVGVENAEWLAKTATVAAARVLRRMVAASPSRGEGGTR